jgi:hypothetical protein
MTQGLVSCVDDHSDNAKEKQSFDTPSMNWTGLYLAD